MDIAVFCVRPIFLLSEEYVLKVFVAVFQMLGLFRLMEVLLNEINYRQGACGMIKYCCLFSCRSVNRGLLGFVVIFFNAKNQTRKGIWIVLYCLKIVCVLSWADYGRENILSHTMLLIVFWKRGNASCSLNEWLQLVFKAFVFQCRQIFCVVWEKMCFLFTLSKQLRVRRIVTNW